MATNCTWLKYPSSRQLPIFGKKLSWPRKTFPVLLFTGPGTEDIGRDCHD